MSEPRTAAGREMIRQLPYAPERWTPNILAIEAEACHHDAKWIEQYTDWVIRAHKQREAEAAQPRLGFRDNDPNKPLDQEAAQPQPSVALQEAAKEMLAHIDAYEDAMGHGYCATQSGDYMDSCTCGYQEQHDRWVTALAAALASGIDPEVLARALHQRDCGHFLDAATCLTSDGHATDAANIEREYARLLAAPAEHVHDWQPTDSQGYSSECVCGEKTSIYP